MKKIFIIAGEASGDYLGGKLMEDIKFLCDGNVEFIGVGGKCMENVGLKTIFSIDELSIIGILEVIGKIFHVKRLIDKTVDEVFFHKPDVIITIDSSGFTYRVDKKIKKHIEKENLSLNLPIIHYVAPPVWAWRKWRAKSMHEFIDKLLVLLPFEADLFNKFNLKTVFVGHPVATDPNFNEPNASEKNIFLKFIDVSVREKFKIITLLPGSRKSELDKHLPIFSEFSDEIIKHYKNVKFIIPVIESLESYLQDAVKDWKQKPIIVTNKYQKNLAYHVSDIAVAASGTVTLELARTGLPSIIIYKTSAITAAIVKYLINIENVCLINILAKKIVVPELIQENCTSQNIFEHATTLLNSEVAQNQQKMNFKDVIDSLMVNDSYRAAKEVLSEIKKLQGA